MAKSLFPPLASVDADPNGRTDFYVNLPETDPTDLGDVFLHLKMAVRKTGSTTGVSHVRLHAIVHLQEQQPDSSWKNLSIQTGDGEAFLEYVGTNPRSDSMDLIFDIGSLAATGKKFRLRVISNTPPLPKVVVDYYKIVGIAFHYSVCHPFTATPTRTSTGTATSSSTISPTRTASPTFSRTFSATPSRSSTPSATPSQTRSATRSATPSATPSVTSSFSATPTLTRSASSTRSPSSTQTPTHTRSSTGTRTVTRSATVSPTPSVTRTASPSPTASITPWCCPVLAGAAPPLPETGLDLASALDGTLYALMRHVIPADPSLNVLQVMRLRGDHSGWDLVGQVFPPLVGFTSPQLAVAEDGTFFVLVPQYLYHLDATGAVLSAQIVPLLTPYDLAAAEGLVFMVGSPGGPAPSNLSLLQQSDGSSVLRPGILNVRSISAGPGGSYYVSDGSRLYRLDNATAPATLLASGVANNLLNFCSAWVPQQGIVLASGVQQSVYNELGARLCFDSSSQARSLAPIPGGFAQMATAGAVSFYLSCDVAWTATTTFTVTQTPTISATFSVTPTRTATPSSTISPTPALSCCNYLSSQAVPPLPAYDLLVPASGAPWLVPNVTNRVYRLQSGGVSSPFGLPGGIVSADAALQEQGGFNRLLIADQSLGLVTVDLSGVQGPTLLSGGATAVAYDAVKNIIFVVDRQHRLHSLDGSSGADVYGVRNLGPGYVMAMAAGPDSTLYLAGYNGGDNGILALDPASGASTLFANDPLDEPSYVPNAISLALRPDGLLLVGDTSHRVRLLSPQGQYLCDLFSQGGGAGAFVFPSSIAFYGAQTLIYDGTGSVQAFDCASILVSSATPTVTLSASLTATSTESPSASATVSETETPSASATESSSPSASCTPTLTESQTASATPTVTESEEASATPTSTPSPSATASVLPCVALATPAPPAACNAWATLASAAQGGSSSWTFGGLGINPAPFVDGDLNSGIALPASTGSPTIGVALIKAPSFISPEYMQVTLAWNKPQVTSADIRVRVFLDRDSSPDQSGVWVPSQLFVFTAGQDQVLCQRRTDQLFLGVPAPGGSQFRLRIDTAGTGNPADPPYSVSLNEVQFFGCLAATATPTVTASATATSTPSATATETPVPCLAQIAYSVDVSPATVSQGWWDGALGAYQVLELDDYWIDTFNVNGALSNRAQIYPGQSYTSLNFQDSVGGPGQGYSYANNGGGVGHFDNTDKFVNFSSSGGNFRITRAPGSDVYTISNPPSNLLERSRPISYGVLQTIWQTPLGAIAKDVAASSSGTVAVLFYNGGNPTLSSFDPNGGPLNSFALAPFTTHIEFDEQDRLIGLQPDQPTTGLSTLSAYEPATGALLARSVLSVGNSANLDIIRGGPGQLVLYRPNAPLPLIVLHACDPVAPAGPAAPAGGASAARISGAPKLGALAPSQPGLLAAPNPLGGLGVLVATLSQQGPARVRIADISGEEVWQRSLPGAGPGAQELSLDFSTRASGIYLAVLEQDSGFGYKPIAWFKLAVAH